MALKISIAGGALKKSLRTPINKPTLAKQVCREISLASTFNFFAQRLRFPLAAFKGCVAWRGTRAGRR